MRIWFKKIIRVEIKETERFSTFKLLNISKPSAVSDCDILSVKTVTKGRHNSDDDIIVVAPDCVAKTKKTPGYYTVLANFKLLKFDLEILD